MLVNNDIISWTLFNNILSQVPMDNIIVQCLIFIYLLREVIPRHNVMSVYSRIKELCYGKTSMISFKLDDDRSNNYSLRFMALSRYLSETYNTNIYNIIEHLNREWDSNDELRDKSFYRVHQKGNFLIDEEKQIYGRVQCSEKEQGNKHNGSTWTKTITELDVFSTKLTVTEIKDWIEDIYLADKRKREAKYEQPHLFTVRWDSGRNCVATSAKKFKSNARFNNSWSPHQKNLIKKLDFFMKNEDYYAEKGWPYTLGIAFVGKPGGGKTRTLKQIINHTGRHGVIVEISDDFKFSELESIMHGHIDTDIIFDPKDIIIIFEDVDTATSIIADRKKIQDKNIAPPVQQSTTTNTVIKVDLPPKKDGEQHLGKLLNIIDGVCERHGGMLFLTSNYPDKIDEALLRPGRIDIKIEVENLSKKELLQFCKHFWGKECDLNELQISSKNDKRYTTADLTELFRSARGNFNSIRSKLVKS